MFIVSQTASHGVRVLAGLQTQSILEDGVATSALSLVFCPVVHTDGCLGASWICPGPNYQCLHHGWLICSTGWQQVVFLEPCLPWLATVMLIHCLRAAAMRH